ncbi:MAG: hypothetical protein Kow0099_03120 [Candidatus Abyssubacteria bacterium]
MSDTNITLIREFLEIHNFSVMLNRKFHLQKAEPTGRYSIDLLAKNLDYANPQTEIPMRLQAEHMRHLSNIIIDVKGWHSEKFSPSLVSGSPELFHFVSPNALKYARSVFGNAPFKSVLVISEASTSEDVWFKMEAMLKERGVDHVLEFPVVLSSLIAHVEVNLNYVESETLQLLRLLKRYELVKGQQLELPFKYKDCEKHDE